MAIVLTKKAVKLAGIAVITIGALAGGYLVASPIITTYQTQQEDIATSNSQLSIQQASLESLRQAKKNYPEIQRIDQELRSQFPELAQTQELLDSIVAGLTSSGLNETNISSIEFRAPAKEVSTPIAVPETPAADGSTAPPAEPVNPGDQVISTTGGGGEFATIEVSLNINGEPENLKKFLDYMNNAERAFIITKFSIANSTSDSNPNSKGLSLTAKVFIYPTIEPPNFDKSGETTTPGEGTTTQPTKPTPQPTTKPKPTITPVPEETTTPEKGNDGNTDGGEDIVGTDPDQETGNN